jgi:NAD(P)-dependent dehydrogenase (short-subunit alcohol dehydrogenase family)
MMRSLKNLFTLKDRVALVTGGAGHIGRAICQTLAEQGASVVVLDRDGAEAVADEVREQYGIATMGVNLDLADEDAVRQVPKRIVSKFGRFDILVNNAAFVGSSELQGWAVPFLEQSAETWRAALEVNLTSAFILSQAASTHLSRGSKGSIINIASIYGVLGPDWRLYEGTGMGNPAAYAASKGGIVQLSRWLATTLAPSVRVNSICPGGVFRGQPDSFLEKYQSRTPMGRMATEEDFKGVVAFLASDASAYVTGQNILVDGGWSAW